MSEWNSMESLPDHRIGARFRMILDGVPQECEELQTGCFHKRWFYGSENGAYPIDEITGWQPIPAPPTE